MAILCREHDLLYIQVPATGSSVVALALQNQLGGERVPTQPVRRGVGPSWVKSTLLCNAPCLPGWLKSVMSWFGVDVFSFCHGLPVDRVAELIGFQVTAAG
jgi:hypothetical protein